MSKNFRKRRDAAWKKEAKKKASLLSSSGGESDHYVSQSIRRHGSLKPVRRRVTEKGIKDGCFGLEKSRKGRFLITNYKTGDKQVVSKDLKAGVTFINTSQ